MTRTPHNPGSTFSEIASHAIFAAAVVVNSTGTWVAVLAGDWSDAAWRACALALVLALWSGTASLRQMMVTRAEFYRTQSVLIEQMVTGKLVSTVEFGEPDTTRH